MSLIQVLNDNNPLPTKDLTRSLHQVIQVHHPLNALKVTSVFLSFFSIIYQETIISTQSSPAYRLLCGGALYQGVFQFLVVLAKKISLSKVPSYIEAFKKELKITYPGISFFTRYARVASLNRKALKLKCFRLFMRLVSKGWCLSKSNKQLL